MPDRTPAPPSLRRSCKSCARGKRRCDQRWPRCSRCLARRIDCEYVNVPLTAGSESMKRQVSHSRGDSNSYNSNPHIRPPPRLEIAKGYERHIISFLVEGLQELPVAFAQDMKTLFIHPDVYETSDTLNIFYDVHAHCRLYLLAHHHMKHGVFFPLIRKKAAQFHRQACNPTSFGHLLSSVQALLLLQCILLLNNNETGASYSETTATMLTDVAEQLWQQAPIQLPHTLSPRRAWLFAESVRRTIIVAFILRSVYSLKMRNYSVRTPFIDSLPFDVRTSLWYEDTEDALNSTSPDPLQSMVSLNQYSTMLENGRVHDINVFGRLILAACKGRSVSEIAFPAATPYQITG